MENGQYDQDWQYIHMMPKKRRRPPMIYAPGRYYRGMPDALCWQNTAGTIRNSGRAAAKDEGLALVTPMLGEPVWVADKTQSFNAWWR